MAQREMFIYFSPCCYLSSRLVSPVPWDITYSGKQLFPYVLWESYHFSEMHEVPGTFVVLAFPPHRSGGSHYSNPRAWPWKWEPELLKPMVCIYFIGGQSYKAASWHTATAVQHLYAHLKEELSRNKKNLAKEYQVELNYSLKSKWSNSQYSFFSLFTNSR